MYRLLKRKAMKSERQSACEKMTAAEMEHWVINSTFMGADFLGGHCLQLHP